MHKSLCLWIRLHRSSLPPAHYPYFSVLLLSSFNKEDDMQLSCLPGEHSQGFNGKQEL